MTIVNYHLAVRFKTSSTIEFCGGNGEILTTCFV